MRIKPTERDNIGAILREEIEEASRRISERLNQFQGRPGSSEEDLHGVRQFYADLTDKAWTEGDEESLRGLGSLGEDEIKRMICEAYRRSPLHPVPGFAYLVNLLKRGDTELRADEPHALRNPDAVSAVERERLANLLHNELSEAAFEIASRLQLNEVRKEIVRERLDIAEGNIIGRFTPLV